MFDYAYKYIGDKTKLIFQATSMPWPVVIPRRLMFIVLDKSSHTTGYHPKPCKIPV
jgi:hypothetical protein